MNKRVVTVMALQWITFSKLSSTRLVPNHRGKLCQDELYAAQKGRLGQMASGHLNHDQPAD